MRTHALYRAVCEEYRLLGTATVLVMGLPLSRSVRWSRQFREVFHTEFY